MSRPARRVRASFIGLLAFGLATAALAQEVKLAIPWSGTSPTTVGTALDVDLVDWNRNSCLVRSKDDVKWLDGDGAVKTAVTVELVKDYQSLARTLNLEVDYKSKADVSIAALKAGASVNLNTKYDSFAQDEGRTLALVVKAFSDYGRKGLEKYTLENKFSDMVAANKLADFRQQCGTHTVVAQHNVAMAAVVILMSDTTASAKRALEVSYSSNFNANVPIQAATISGSSDMKANWKTLVETAQRTTKMQVTFESKGGEGIPDGLKAAATADPEKVDAILAALTAIGASFTQAKSAPVEYLLVPNTVLGVKAKVVDASKLDTLNSFYLQLARVDKALSRIDGYRNYPALFKVYDESAQVLKLRAYRSQLVSAIEACTLTDVCTYQAPKDLGMLFAEDIITLESLKLQCTYKRFDSGDKRVKLNVLSYAAVVLRGDARLPQFVDLPTALINRLGPESQPPRTIKSAWVAYSGFEPAKDAEGKFRFLGQLDYEIFRPEVDVSAGTVVVRNEAQMARLRADMLASLYSINMQAKNGVFVQNLVGPPFGGECPLTQPAL